MLMKNKTLERLSLKDNGIGSEGAVGLLSGLVSNTQLGHLSLEKNPTINPMKISDLKNLLSSRKVIVVDSISAAGKTIERKS